MGTSDASDTIQQEAGSLGTKMQPLVGFLNWKSGICNSMEAMEISLSIAAEQLRQIFAI